MTADILLIESSRLSAPSFAPSLEKKGYRVHVKNGVGEALECHKSAGLDLVILDAASMQTSGLRMCKKLASSLNGIPII